MIGQKSRRIDPHFERGNWSNPRFFRGHRQRAFFYARPGHRRFGGHWQQPTPEQLALRSTAAEVARLFVIAARTSRGDAEKQNQLRAFLENSRKELSEFIYGSSQQPQEKSAEDEPEVEQA